MNRLFVLLFGLVSFAAHAQVPDYVPTEGLVDWWPLDGNATNLVGDNDGEIEGCLPTENRFGEASKALFFDGQNDRVSLDTFFGGQQMAALSYSLWFHSNGSPETQYLSGKEGFWRTIYIRLTSANDIRFGGTSQGVYFGVTSDEQAFALGTWHHLVVTFEDAVITLFLDGYQIAQGSSAANLLDYQFYAAGNSTATNYFGAIHPVSPGLCHFFSGKMDDFGLWDRALTESEVLTLYNAEPPVLGCTDSAACNYNDDANEDDGSCVPSGCMEPLACNYNALAECTGEACDYSCCPGPGCCSAGMYWDYDVEQCMNYETCEDDLDGDGVIGVNDLMQLLSSFGTDCAPAEEPESTEFTCGDPVSYQGYDYATVQIGEQCWFAENARHLPFVSPSNLGWEDDGNAHAYVAGYEGTLVEEAQMLGEYEVFGALYNFAAVEELVMCPQGWHVPSVTEWNVLEAFIGPSSAFKLKADAPAWDGTNELGFNAIRVPVRISGGTFGNWEEYADFWTSTSFENSDNAAWGRELNTGDDEFTHDDNGKNAGCPVRCIKD